MVARITLFFSLVAVSASLTVPPPSANKMAPAEPTAPVHYAYEYSVNEPHYGDVKMHRESRDGDHTKGSYSLLQPDGSQRIVEYTVDKESGFKAKVRYEGKPASAPTKTSFPAPATSSAPVAEVMNTMGQSDAKEAPSNYGNVYFRSPAAYYYH